MSAPLLEARALAVGYGTREVLAGLSFSAESGSLTAVLGANGSGKTTLLKSCLGLIPALGGEALLGGRPVGAIAPRERASLASWVPQAAFPSGDYSARDVATQGRYRLRGPFGRHTAEDREAVEAALAAMGVERLAERRMSSLSGGEARRVLVARALAQDAPLLVLDEPAAHLDPGGQVELLELLRSLAKEGRGVVVSLHDVNAASRFADSILLIGADGTATFGAPSEALRPERLESAFGAAFVHGSHDAYGAFVLPVTKRR